MSGQALQLELTSLAQEAKRKNPEIRAVRYAPSPTLVIINRDAKSLTGSREITARPKVLAFHF